MSERQKLLELEREFRETVLNELKIISKGQGSLENRLDTLDKRVELHIQKMTYEIENINRLDQEQNKSIEKYADGLNTLKSIHEAHKEELDKRIFKMEIPTKVLKFITNKFVLIGGVAAASLSIAKFFNLI